MQKLPPGSVARFQGITDDRVILRDTYNNSWVIEMERDGDYLWFKKGWPKFYEDNSLEPDEVIVFQYEGKNLFSFKLLGHDTCLKKGLGDLRNAVKEEVEDYTDGVNDLSPIHTCKFAIFNQ